MDLNLKLNVISLLGVYGICFVAWLSSENRKLIPWNVIKWGIGIQFVFGFVFFVLPFSRGSIEFLSSLIDGLLNASEAGARFLFSSLIVPDPKLGGIVEPKDLINPQTGVMDYSYLINPKTGMFERKRLDLGFIFAFRSLPQVIFFSAIITLMYRMNLIQPVVRFFAVVFQKTLGTSGAESLSGAANIFVGIESVIAVKPFLQNMTRSELCAILASCFGSISSTVLGMYAGFLRPTFPAITGHLMIASLLTIPACFVISKIIVPETSVPETLGSLPDDKEDPTVQKPSYMDSLILGALDGVKMAVGIAAVIIAILGCVAVVNGIFEYLAELEKSDYFVVKKIGTLFKVVSLDNIFGLLFLPLTFMTGVSLDMGELWQASVLIGQRVLQTSVPPYVMLGKLSREGLITDRTLLIVSYVLCGFAHIPSIGIFVGGMTNLVPSRAHEISAIAWKSMWAATLATLMTGAIAGVYDFGFPGLLGSK